MDVPGRWCRHGRGRAGPASPPDRRRPRPGRCRRCAAARAGSRRRPRRSRGGSGRSAQPAAVSGCPRFGPLATMNMRALAVSGPLGQQVRLDHRADVDDPAAPGVPGCPCRVTCTHRPPMSTSATSRPRTSALRSPQYSISPAIARSRQVRKLASNSAASPLVQRPRQPPRLAQPQRRTGLRAPGGMRQQAVAFPGDRPAGLASFRHRVRRAGSRMRPEREQPRDRRSAGG